LLFSSSTRSSDSSRDKSYSSDKSQDEESSLEGSVIQESAEITVSPTPPGSSKQLDLKPAEISTTPKSTTEIESNTEKISLEKSVSPPELEKKPSVESIVLDAVISEIVNASPPSKSDNGKKTFFSYVKHKIW